MKGATTSPNPSMAFIKSCTHLCHTLSPLLPCRNLTPNPNVAPPTPNLTIPDLSLDFSMLSAAQTLSPSLFAVSSRKATFPPSPEPYDEMLDLPEKLRILISHGMKTRGNSGNIKFTLPKCTPSTDEVFVCFFLVFTLCCGCLSLPYKSHNRTIPNRNPELKPRFSSLQLNIVSFAKYTSLCHRKISAPCESYFVASFSDSLQPHSSFLLLCFKLGLQTQYNGFGDLYNCITTAIVASSITI
ncbi:hypothetical protein VNO80_03056 [Phaseolus coccineus]|uniref:Uncharacterized protein n=1 Tax=Phaseolus coccineus TaxID=3886 RepID=A0AAN9RNB0_PHACN